MRLAARGSVVECSRETPRDEAGDPSSSLGAAMTIFGILLRIVAIGLFAVGGVGVLVITFESRMHGISGSAAAPMALAGLIYVLVCGGSGCGLWLLAGKLLRKSRKKHRHEGQHSC